MALPGPTAVLIAVSKTSNPLDGFRIFSLNTTNDGMPGTGNNPDCPCLPDQPLIGTDDNGLYITTNEYSTGDGSFGFFDSVQRGTDLRCFEAEAGGCGEQRIERTDPGGVCQRWRNTDADTGGIWYTVQPAVTPPNKPGNDGTSNKMKGIQYFLSALEFFGVPDNRIAVWALTNTNSLQSAAPNVQISLDVVNTATAYVSPPSITQKGSSRKDRC